MQFEPAQVQSALRQAGQFAAGAATFAAVMGAVPPDTAHAITEAVNEVVQGLSQATAGIGKLVVIIGPIAGALIAKAAFFRSGTKSKIDDARAIAADTTQPGAAEAKRALIAAVDSLPAVAGVVTAATPEGQRLAQAVPSPTVVPAGTVEAKAIAA